MSAPYGGAVLHGNLEIAALLEAAGADTSRVETVDRFVGACLAGNRTAVETAIAQDPALLLRVLDKRGDLVARAAELERSAAVRLLIELGFEVNARHRTTALHEAALRGNLPILKVLLDLGADPTIVDESYNSTPTGWAEHNGHPHIVAFLNHTGTAI